MIKLQITFTKKEVPKVDSHYTCLAVILLDCIFKMDENYYPKVFLKEWKYIKYVIRHAIDDLNFFSDDSDEY